MTGKAGSQIARSRSGAPHIHSADRAPFAEDNCASCQPFEVTRVTDADAWNRLACFRFLESDHPDILYFAGFSSGEKENVPPLGGRPESSRLRPAQTFLRVVLI